MRLKQRMKLFYDRWKSPLVIEIHLTDHCNLNCIGCSHYSPLAPEVQQMEEQKKRAPKPLEKPIHKQIAPVLIRRNTTS